MPRAPGKPIAPGKRDDAFYRLLAGVAHTKLLESVVDLRLPSLLAAQGPLSAAEIAEALGLHPRRAGKWLQLLGRTGLVTEKQGRYANSRMAEAMFWDAPGRESFFVRDMIHYCRLVNAFDLPEVLRGIPLPETVRYPPRTPEEVQHLEHWMTITSRDTLTALQTAVEWTGVRTLLDVGGGDGTMACTMARAYPRLRVSVFNLPASAELARARIAREGLADRVQVVVGDFLVDDLPTGFERVLFSRVLADWEPEVCTRLIGLARAALAPGGSLLICEPFIDRNPDLALSWQFRYIFYDDLAVESYKFVRQYRSMLAAAGFSAIRVQDRVADTIYGVITAS
jgi:DNA-binding transcriptional ArsR family regulator